MNSDRGIIKWAPFNSTINNKELISGILKEKKKIKMPDLSEEQKRIIENKIINAFYTGEDIKLEYFYNGMIFTLNERIKKIDSTYHKIYFKNQILLFEQIVKIY